MESVLPLLLFLSLFGSASLTPLPTTSTAAGVSGSPRTSPTMDLWDYLPPEWFAMCTVDYDSDEEVNATISCQVSALQKEQWRLSDLRKSLGPIANTTQLEVAVIIQCENGGTISLPFPMRSPALVKLTVYNCRLLDKYADFLTPAEKLKDSLRVLDMRNCVWMNDPDALQQVLDNLDKMTDHYECGQDSTLASYTYRNISDRSSLDSLATSDSALEDLLGEEGGSLADLLNGTMDLEGLFNDTLGGLGGLVDEEAGSDGLTGLSAGSDMFTPQVTGKQEVLKSVSNNSDISADDLLQTLIDADSIQVQCLFAQLEMQDESFSPITNRNHFEFMVKESKFPKLRLLNYTAIGLTEVPLELRESRRKFPGSPLGVIDISHNYVQQVGVIPPYPSRGIHTTLILQYNNISQIFLKMFQTWALIPDFFIDIRNNPIDCGCQLKALLIHMQNRTLWTGKAMTYYRQQLSVLTCATPTALSRRAIGSLTVDDLQCLVDSADLIPAMAALLSIVVVLLVLLAFAIKYRKEVRILIYTRVHILLPCGLPRHPSAYAAEKTYDAFVAYAHQDSEWVLGSLVQRLEESSHSKGHRPCKLCIHQRDFVVGKPIIDNIIESIAASRHTIVILSKSFVQSGWAMEELAHAYRQSIEERRRHLVVVVLEDVPQDEMGPVLRRCCKTFTYLHVSDTLFWDRLLYSIHVAPANISKKSGKSKGSKSSSISSEGEKEDISNAASVNKAYRSDMEYDDEEDMDKEESLDQEFKATLFSETMRMMSVDSCSSTLSDTGIPVTPSQLKMDRHLFHSEA